MSKLRRVLLVDDYEADNFLHQMLFEELGCVEQVDVCMNGQEALDYLTMSIDGNYPQPDLICLDINMPVMGGWEFLAEYQKLPQEQCANVVLMMITTSENPDDKTRALDTGLVTEYQTKPLSRAYLEEVINEYFPGVLQN